MLHLVSVKLSLGHPSVLSSSGHPFIGEGTCSCHPVQMRASSIAELAVRIDLV